MLVDRCSLRNYILNTVNPWNAVVLLDFYLFPVSYYLEGTSLNV